MENDEFLYLVSQQLSDQSTAAESERLRQLLAGSEVLRQKYYWLESFWQEKEPVSGDVKREFEKILAKIDTPQREENSLYAEQVAQEFNIGRIRYPLKKLLAAAAVLLVLVTAGYFFYSFSGKKTAHVPVGKELMVSEDKWIERKNEKRKKVYMVLPDSTKIWLNGESLVKYNDDFGKYKREIYLSGEAFFDVAHNEKVPMTVHVQNIDIRVKGTAFNVSSYPTGNKVETSLIRGLVEVTNRIEPDRKILLKPNEKLVVMGDGKTNVTANTTTDENWKKDGSPASPYIIQKLTPEASTQLIPEISWLEDKLVFNHETFENLAAQMQRWYGVTIYFKNDEVRQFRYTGAFDKENIRQALGALQLSYYFEYSIHNNEITIRK